MTTTTDKKLSLFQKHGVTIYSGAMMFLLLIAAAMLMAKPAGESTDALFWVLLGVAYLFGGAAVQAGRVQARRIRGTM